MNAATLSSPLAARAAVFVDRDGTLIEDVPSNADPRQVRFTRDAIEGLILLQAFGYAIVLVTHQPGVGLGLFDDAALQALHADLRARLVERGVDLAAIYACAHPPGAGCGCRKPEPGLLLRAAGELDLALERSWMIGDILDDIEAGTNAGCRTVLLDVGNETVWRDSPRRRPTLRAQTLFEAAHAIIERTTRETAAAPHAAAAAAGHTAAAVPL